MHNFHMSEVEGKRGVGKREGGVSRVQEEEDENTNEVEGRGCNSVGRVLV